MIPGLIAAARDSGGGAGHPGLFTDLRSNNETATNPGSLTITIPPGGTNGDLMIAILFTDTTIGTNFWTTPAGWILLDHIGTTTSDATQTIFYRTIDGTEGSSQTFVISSTSLDIGGFIAYRDGYSGITNLGELNSQTDFAFDVRGVVTAHADDLALTTIVMDGGDAIPVTTEAGWTEEVQADVGGAGGVGYYVAAKVVSTAGLQSDETFTGSGPSDGYLSRQITLSTAGNIPTASVGTHRYWRVYMSTASGNLNSFSATALEMWLALDGFDTVEVGNFRTTLTTSQQGLGEEVVLLADGYAPSFWQSSFAGQTQWVKVDYDSVPVEVVKIGFTSRTNNFSECPVDYLIQYSDDNVNWTTSWSNVGLDNFSSFLQTQYTTAPWAANTDVMTLYDNSVHIVMGRVEDKMTVNGNSINIVVEP